MRWYDDDVDGQKRRDIRPSVTVKAIWTPEWLTKQIPKAEINFALFFQRNISTIAEEEFTQWELGPPSCWPGSSDGHRYSGCPAREIRALSQ